MIADQDAVCTPGKPWNAEFDRFATVNEAKESHKSWEHKVERWTIVGLNGGVAKGPGYGNQIVNYETNESGFENGQPRCDKWGEFLMCLSCATPGEL